jgi:hypothetical protein
MVSPFTKFLCTRAVKITMGNMAKTPAAAMWLHMIPVSRMKPVRETGTVWARVPVRIRAKRNSFQEKINVKIPVAASPGAIRGKAMRKKAPKGEQPSTMALSSISRGISWKKLRKSQTAKGTLKVQYARIRAALVSKSLRVLIIRKIGIAAAIGGVMRMERIQKERSLDLLNLNLANPYAAKDPTRREIKVLNRATTRLFTR